MIEVDEPAIRAAYELLRTQRPFKGWKLPNDVDFTAIKCREFYSDCNNRTIRVSASLHGHLSTLLASVAHEMIHLHQMRNSLETANTEHNADFRKRAANVCRVHGWDPKDF